MFFFSKIHIYISISWQGKKPLSEKGGGLWTRGRQASGFGVAGGRRLWLEQGDGD